MIRMKLTAALVILLVPSAASAAAEKLALLPVSGVNIHPGYLDAARDLLKDHLTSTGRFSVISVPGQALDHEYTAQEAVDLGRPAHADLVVVTHIVHLAGTSRVRVTALRASDSSIVHTDSMATAGGPDDLDPVLHRLAVSLATGKPAAQNGDIETVSQRESDPYLKQTATRVFGLRLGAVLPMNRPVGDSTTSTGLGLFWLYDAREFMAELWVDFYRSSSDGGVSLFDVGIGGYYPLSRNNVTPYVGAGAAWSASSQRSASGSGLRMNAAAGMLVGRLWTVQCRAELGWFFNTFSERALEGGPSHFSHGPMLTLGLGF
jgi:hypothetical protein